MTSPSPDHPRIPLLFYIVGEEVDDDDADGMEELVSKLAGSRSWTIAPPEFIDDVEEGTQERDLDLPLVGGVVEIYSGYPPWGDRLPLEVDRAQLDEVRCTIAALSDFSREYDREIAIEYGGELIGTIVAGAPHPTLTEGLLGPWEQQLARREGGGAP